MLLTTESKIVNILFFCSRFINGNETERNGIELARKKSESDKKQRNDQISFFLFLSLSMNVNYLVIPSIGKDRKEKDG